MSRQAPEERLAGALEFPLSPDTEVVGAVQTIEAAHEDTFVRLARRYDVGFEELRQANPDVDPERANEWWSRRTNKPLDLEAMRKRYDSRKK